MIKEIEIKNTATYDSIGQKIEPLANINFFYGANGSGKTTISRVIENKDKYPNCSVVWANNSPIKTFVYNRDFVDSNFNSRSELKGIFTLGKDAKDTRDKIETKKQESTKIDKEIESIQEKIKKETPEKNKINNLFIEECWKIKKKYDSYFGKAFEGFKANKVKFNDKVLKEQDNSYNLLSYEKLKEKADKIFHGSTDKVPLIPNIDFSNISTFENNAILQTKIIGKQDVNIASLIKKLNNSDWVKQGREFLPDDGDDICPFCQQSTITNNLKNELEEYFDETYVKQINELKKLIGSYKNYLETKCTELENILPINNQYINKEKLEDIKTIINSKLTINLIKFENKSKNPSLVIELDSIIDKFQEIEGVIKETNSKTINHNSIIANIVKEREQLKNEVWCFIVEELKDESKTYKGNINNIEKMLMGLNSSLQKKQGFLNSVKSDISKLEQTITSVKPTIDAINHTLKTFSFTGFKLKEDEAQVGNYLIVRDDNTIVARTLSEGEKTFITFLYFYHLIKGSFENSSITEERIVVFDDPISSLDSNVLFLISSLIKEIIEKIRNKEITAIKQVFLMTHNTYFHKEVSYRKDNKNDRKDETFWIVRKENNISNTTLYPLNPIKTSYEFLWNEIKEPNKATLQNTLRRILENYFNFQGKNLHDLANLFENEEEQTVCRSLISWIHDGSHHILDDFHVDNSDETSERYLSVFKSIFEKTHHIEHYKMMMGEE